MLAIAAFIWLAPQFLRAAACEPPTKSAAQTAPVRRASNFNRKCKFMLGDPAGAEKPEYDDRAWRSIHLESGPGEFPTGPSMRFEPDSDIAIREGQAAIEFRSYHAGKTVIRDGHPPNR